MNAKQKSKDEPDKNLRQSEPLAGPASGETESAGAGRGRKGRTGGAQAGDAGNGEGGGDTGFGAGSRSRAEDAACQGGAAPADGTGGTGGPDGPDGSACTDSAACPEGADRPDSRPGQDGAETGDQADARQEAARLKDQLLRLTADFDNYRKRMLREKQDWLAYASQGVMEKLLPVLDGLDAAAGAVTSTGQEAKNVAEGFLMIQKQLTDILSQEGLTGIPALGEDFDPNVHEAVMTVPPGEGQEDNQIVMVLRKGYKFKDKVLRPAMVQVAKD